MFKTDRLHLRAFEGPADADRLLSLFNNALVAPLIANDFIVPRGPKFKDGLADSVQKALMWCMIDELPENGGAFVGFVSFSAPPDAKNRNADFGIAILPQFWSKGYGTEVMKFMVDYGFRSLALHRISLFVFEGNDRAIALYRDMGFVEEGKSRKSMWVDGGWRDIISMGILVDEWEERKDKGERS